MPLFYGDTLDVPTSSPGYHCPLTLHQRVTVCVSDTQVGTTTWGAGQVSPDIRIIEIVRSRRSQP